MSARGHNNRWANSLWSSPCGIWDLRELDTRGVANKAERWLSANRAIGPRLFVSEVHCLALFLIDPFCVRV